MFAAFAIGHHFAISSLWKERTASGVCCSRGPNRGPGSFAGTAVFDTTTEGLGALSRPGESAIILIPVALEPSRHLDHDRSGHAEARRLRIVAREDHHFRVLEHVVQTAS